MAAKWRQTSPSDEVNPRRSPWFLCPQHPAHRDFDSFFGVLAPKSMSAEWFCFARWLFESGDKIGLPYVAICCYIIELKLDSNWSMLGEQWKNKVSITQHSSDILLAKPKGFCSKMPYAIEIPTSAYTCRISRGVAVKQAPVAGWPGLPQGWNRDTTLRLKKSTSDLHFSRTWDTQYLRRATLSSYST